MVRIIPYQEKKAIIKSIFVAPDVILIGDVRLADKSSIWFGSILKGDTSQVIVGEGTQILEQSYIENSIIGEGCLVSHKAIIHEATIGNKVLIGMNSGIYNDAIVGNNCIIGAGCLILPKKKIPDNSVVIGNPGKIIRSTNDDDINYIISSVQKVLEKAKIIRNEI